MFYFFCLLYQSYHEDTPELTGLPDLSWEVSDGLSFLQSENFWKQHLRTSMGNGDNNGLSGTTAQV